MESTPPPDWRDKREKRCYWITRVEISQEKLEPRQGSPPRNTEEMGPLLEMLVEVKNTQDKYLGFSLACFHSPTIVAYFQKTAGI